MHNQILFGVYIFSKLDIWAETFKKNVKNFLTNVCAIVYETVSGDLCASPQNAPLKKRKPRLIEKCRHTPDTLMDDTHRWTPSRL